MYSRMKRIINLIINEEIKIEKQIKAGIAYTLIMKSKLNY